jgi:predicted amidohydrolase
MPLIKLALFQARPAYRTVEQALADLEKAVSEAALSGAQLVITPELFLSGYGNGEAVRNMAQPSNSPVLSAVARIAARHRVGLVLGYPEQDGTRLYNNAIVFDQVGKCLHTYRKTALPNDFERSCFSTGVGPSVFEFMDVRCSVVICYDIEFPELARRAATGGAELLIVPTALRKSWRIVSDCVVPTRAYENGMFVAYCDFAYYGNTPEFSGASTVCAPNGAHLIRNNGCEGLLIAEVETDAVSIRRNEFDFLKHLPALAGGLDPEIDPAQVTHPLPRKETC